MEEAFNNAKQELKRVDHLIFVSLKYTRTADVLKNILTRLIDAYDFLIQALLKKAMEDERLDEMPTAPILKAEKAKEIYSEDERIIKAIDFYLLLRKLNKAEYEAFNEYRRHLTMKVELEGKEYEITIDKATDYYKEALDFVEYLKNSHLDSE